MPVTTNVLVISDNLILIRGILNIIRTLDNSCIRFEFKCSPGSLQIIKTELGFPIEAISVKNEYEQISKIYDLIISLHCKQLFPKELVKGIRCINVHPGLNPHNRGWFPQVFSILNGLPTGATIHEIDEHLDHGAIIAQSTVPNYTWDTSIDIYNRVVEMELILLEQYLIPIVQNEYSSIIPKEEGNLNLKKDFDMLCELDPNKVQSIGKTIDLLRALTHGEYKNAYFIDSVTGKKVFVSIDLQPETPK